MTSGINEANRYPIERRVDENQNANPVAVEHRAALAASITDADLESIATDREPMDSQPPPPASEQESGLASGGKEWPNGIGDWSNGKLRGFVVHSRRRLHLVFAEVCEDGSTEDMVDVDTLPKGGWSKAIPATSHAELVEQLEAAQLKLRQSHHLCCNYHERVLGECNCVAVMKKELAELTTAQALLREREAEVVRLTKHRCEAMDREAGVLAYCAKISPDELDDYEACDVARKVEEILRGEA